MPPLGDITHPLLIVRLVLEALGAIALCVFLMALAGEITITWPRMAARFTRKAQDWLNPDVAPPAFDNIKPHEFRPAENLPCCASCGGGKLHAIHAGGAAPVAAGGTRAFPALLSEYAAEMREEPGFGGGDGFRGDKPLRHR